MLFTIKSYAKLNLFLSIKGRRRDGYHLLLSLMSHVDLYDIIRLSPNNAHLPSLVIKGNFGGYFDNLSSDALNSNTIILALRHMCRKYSIDVGFDIVLQKNIPLTSGMGGGSSNAASIILFCNDYFDLRLTHEEMMQDAQCIGSDVPFFINNKMALCSGAGEVVSPIDLAGKSMSVVLINPMLPLSTPEVYSNIDLSSCQFSDLYGDEFWDDLRSGNIVMNDQILLSVMQHCGNDLTTSAVQIMPKITDILQTLGNLRGLLLPRMSGSGATCFAFCYSEALASEAVSALKVRYPLAFVSCFKLLPRVEKPRFVPSAVPCFSRALMMSDAECA